MDYQVYSGRELAKAWGADLIPVATGLGGGLVGSGAGPVGAFAVGVAGATFGDRIKDEIKFNLKKDVDKFVYEEYNTKYYNQILIHYLSTSFFKLYLILSLTYIGSRYLIIG